MNKNDYIKKYLKYKNKYNNLVESVGGAEGLTIESCTEIPYIWGWVEHESTKKLIINYVKESMVILNRIKINEYKHLVIHFAGKCKTIYDIDYGTSNIYYHNSCQEFKKLPALKDEKTLVLSIDPHNEPNIESDENYDIYHLKLFISKSLLCIINITLLTFIDEIIKNSGKVVIIDSLSFYPQVELLSNEIYNSFRSIDTLNQYYNLKSKYDSTQFIIFKEVYIDSGVSDNYINHFIDFNKKNIEIDILYYIYNINQKKYMTKDHFFKLAYEKFSTSGSVNNMFVLMKIMGIKFSNLLNFIIEDKFFNLHSEMLNPYRDGSISQSSYSKMKPYL